jgi:hypothetical protein
MPLLGVLFALDGIALLIASAWSLTRPVRGWRVACSVLLLGGLLAYAGYVASGTETADAVGVATKLVELASLGLLVLPDGQAHETRSTRRYDSMNLSRIYAIAFGVVYTLVGLIGLAVAPTLATATLIVFPVNVLHNAVHILVGVVGIAAFLSNRTVEYARGMAVLFAVLTIAGLLPQPLLGLVPLGGLDIALHAATALLAAAAGWLYAARRTATA